MARKHYDDRNDDDYPDEELPEPRRSFGRWLIWLIFVAPGAAFMWVQYMFPRYGDVLASGRRYGHRGLQVVFTLVLYGLTLLYTFPWWSKTLAIWLASK